MTTTAPTTTDTSRHNTVDKISRECSATRDRDFLLVCRDVKLGLVHKCKTNFYSPATKKTRLKSVFCRLERMTATIESMIGLPDYNSQLGRPGRKSRRSRRPEKMHSLSCKRIIANVDITVTVVVLRQGRVHHTRLYSLRFNCSIVSLTAANTKRMFSVSAEKHHNAAVLKSVARMIFTDQRPRQPSVHRFVSRLLHRLT